MSAKLFSLTKLYDFLYINRYIKRFIFFCIFVLSFVLNQNLEKKYVVRINLALKYHKNVVSKIMIYDYF